MTADTRVVTILGLVVTLGACGGTASPPATTPPPAKVDGRVTEGSLTTITLTAEAVARLGIETALVEEREVAHTRSVGGDVIAAGGADVRVTAPFAGTIEAVGAPAVVGTRITKGAPLFRLVPLALAERDLKGDAARAVDEAVARQDLAAKQADRAARLAQDGSGSRRAAEEAQASLAIATTTLAAARERLALATSGAAANGSLLISSPLSATVRAIHVAPGQTVAVGAALVDVVDGEVVWIRVPVFSGDLHTVDRRAPARVTALNSTGTADGAQATPVAASPVGDPAAATVDLHFALTNSQGLWQIGQRVTVRLPLASAATSLLVPQAALLHDAYGGVWVYEAKDARTFVRRRVSVSDIVSGFAVLQRGPAPGTRIVTMGAAELFGTEFGVGK